MQYHFWYILIHIGLGMVGYQYFQFNNLGGLYAAGAAGFVQAYAMWEIHKAARPRFQHMLAQEPSHLERQKQTQEYKKRLARVWLTRTCLYALLTLISAMATRGNG